jgi:hypothetical protein
MRLVTADVLKTVRIDRAVDSAPRCSATVVADPADVIGDLRLGETVTVPFSIDDVAIGFTGLVQDVTVGPHRELSVELVDSGPLGRLATFFPAGPVEYRGCERDAYRSDCFWTVHGVLRDVCSRAGVSVALYIPDCPLGATMQWHGESALDFMRSVLDAAGFSATGKHRADILGDDTSVAVLLRSRATAERIVPASRVVRWQVTVTEPASRVLRRATGDVCVEGSSYRVLEPERTPDPNDPCNPANRPDDERRRRPDPAPVAPPPPDETRDDRLGMDPTSGERGSSSSGVEDRTDPCERGSRVVAVIERRTTRTETSESQTTWHYDSIGPDCVLVEEERRTRVEYDSSSKSPYRVRQERTEVRYGYVLFVQRDASGHVIWQKVAQHSRMERTLVWWSRKDDKCNLASDTLVRERVEYTKWAVADRELYPELITTVEYGWTDDELCDALKSGKRIYPLPLVSTETRRNVRNGRFMLHTASFWRYDTEGNLVESREVQEQSVGEWQTRSDLVGPLERRVELLERDRRAIQDIIERQMREYGLPRSTGLPTPRVVGAVAILDGSVPRLAPRLPLGACERVSPPPGYRWREERIKSGACDGRSAYRYDAAGDQAQVDRIRAWLTDEAAHLLHTLRCTLVAMPDVSPGNVLAFQGIPELGGKRWYVTQVTTEISPNGATQSVTALAWSS